MLFAEEQESELKENESTESELKELLKHLRFLATNKFYQALKHQFEIGLKYFSPISWTIADLLQCQL